MNKLNISTCAFSIKVTSFIALWLLMIFVSHRVSAQVVDEQKDATTEKQEIKDAGETATAIVKLLSKKDWVEISKIIHPKRGLKFSPYAYVFLGEGVVVKANEIEKFVKSDQKILWGNYEGRGNPIKLSMKEYYDLFLFRYDYHKVNHGGMNTRVGKSSSVNTILKVYPEPNIAYFDFYFKEKPKEVETLNDWGSLRVVLEQKDGQWFLISLVNDQWGP